MAGAAPPRFADVLLPWNTPLLTGLAGLTSAAPVVLLTLTHYSLTWSALTLALAGAAGALVGLGAVVVERLFPRWPRPLRWAVGMAARGLVPVFAPVVFWYAYATTGQIAPALFQALLDVVFTLVAGGLTGLGMGLAATRSEGLFWRLLIAGGAIGMVRSLLSIPLAAAEHAAVGVPLAALTWQYWGELLLSNCLFGLFLGLALAERLSAAYRAQTDEAWPPTWGRDLP